MNYKKYTQTTVRPLEHEWEVRLNQIWKAKIPNDGSGVYEDNIRHAISCECCIPLAQCNKNDEERQRHNIKSKIKRHDANTRYIDRRMFFSKVNIPIEQKSELITMRYPKEVFFSV